MDNMEKRIEGMEEEYNNIEKEVDTIIKHRINRNRNDDKKNKIILYAVIGGLVLLIGGLLTYVFVNNNMNNDSDNENKVVDGELDDEPVEDIDNVGYVSCDDNTALLNVRNSTTGNIVDGLSCYKEVTIDEELDGTDTCDNWYKISYNKSGSNYTGYACGNYIKKLDIDKKVLKDTKSILDKALGYYKANTSGVYCGRTSSSKIMSFDNGMTGKYVKSEFKDMEQLKNHLLSFLDEDLIDVKLELSDINNSKYYDNYYVIDGSLYCRNYVGSGVNSYYTGNYDIEIASYDDNKIIVNIAYQYINEDSDCELDDISNCKKNNFIYEIGKAVIENNIITKMDFYK